MCLRPQARGVIDKRSQYARTDHHPAPLAVTFPPTMTVSCVPRVKGASTIFVCSHAGWAKHADCAPISAVVLPPLLSLFRATCALLLHPLCAPCALLMCGGISLSLSERPYPILIVLMRRP